MEIESVAEKKAVFKHALKCVFDEKSAIALMAFLIIHQKVTRGNNKLELQELAVIAAEVLGGTCTVAECFKRVDHYLIGFNHDK